MKLNIVFCIVYLYLYNDYKYYYLYLIPTLYELNCSLQKENRRLIVRLCKDILCSDLVYVWLY